MKCTLKRLVSLAVFAVMIISVSTVAIATEESEIVAEWRQQGFVDDDGGVLIDDIYYYENIIQALWEQHGYPDDSGGVYYDDDAGVMGFLLVNPTPERIAELNALAGYDLLITPCVYSQNELMRIHGEISAGMGADSKIYSVGFGWTITDDGVVHGFGESGKECRIVVGVAASEFDRYIAEFAQRYGDKVVVNISSESITLDSSEPAQQPDSSSGVGSDSSGDGASQDQNQNSGQTQNPDDDSETPGKFWIFIICGVGVIVILVAGAFFKRFKKKQVKEEKEEEKEKEEEAEEE